MTNDVGYTLTPFNHVARAGKASASHLRCTNPSVTALWAATAPLSGEPRVGGGGWPCASAFRDIGVRRAGAVHVQSPRMGAGFFYSVGASSGGFLPLCRARAVVSGRFSLRSSKKAMTEKVTAPRKQTKRSSIVS